MNPVEQLRAGRLPQRIAQLMAGLVLYGASMALFIRSTLGQMPWDVLHVGLSHHVPLTVGQITIVTSFIVLLLWIPLRQMPGLGTLANAVVIGLALDVALTLIAAPTSLPVRLGLMLAGLGLNGVATAMYIGSQLGPGPRDGLMTGLSRRTGRSIRLVRTTLEVIVVVLGWLLGGLVGLGTIVYALGIGPITQALLPYFIVELDQPPTT